MALTLQQVEHIAQLASLGLTPAELELFREQLGKLLDHFQKLEELDTAQVPPATHPAELYNVTREDQARPSFPRGEMLFNAPRELEGYVLVPSVLET